MHWLLPLAMSLSMGGPQVQTGVVEGRVLRQATMQAMPGRVILWRAHPVNASLLSKALSIGTGKLLRGADAL